MIVNADFAKDVVAQSTMPESRDHGEQHWKAVAYAGLELQVPNADLELVLLFALFHDSQRESEFHDPEHGARGALFALRMLEDKLDPVRMKMLMDACILHDNGEISSSQTIGACWDADRLNLWRVGIEPNPDLMSTPEAKDPKLIEEAQLYHGLNLSWRVLFREYEVLIGPTAPRDDIAEAVRLAHEYEAWCERYASEPLNSLALATTANKDTSPMQHIANGREIARALIKVTEER